MTNLDRLKSALESRDADFASLLHSISNAGGVPVEFLGDAKMAVELLGKDRDKWKAKAQDLCPHDELESFVCLECGKDCHPSA